MPSSNTDLGNRGGGLVETFRNSQPRVAFLAVIVAGLLLLLVGGVTYQQLIKTGIHANKERLQSQRLTVTPGPRGEIYDRDGRVLIGNRHRLSVALELSKLQAELFRERVGIRKAYLAAGGDVPSDRQIRGIASVTVVQRYLDMVNRILGTEHKVDKRDLLRHFEQELLLPYILLDNLDADSFARLHEQLPVRSPLQVHKSAVREYPYGAAAAHVLGQVKWDTDIDAETLPEAEDLATFRMKGIVGRDGIEGRYDSVLQGRAGAAIYRVNPAGYQIEPALSRRLPRQGANITTSIDIDLQTVAEKEFEQSTGGLKGGFVALDVNTGEVLAIASFPNFDLRETSPRVTTEKYEELKQKNALLNRAINGFYPPGSTFKIVTALAGMRSGVMTPDSTYVTNGTYTVGGRAFNDATGDPVGLIDFTTALEKSVNTYFINFGMKMGAETIAAEARRLGLAETTGIELGETRAMLVGTDEWKRRERQEPWRPGDTANIAFGQGYLAVTPLQMACLVASFARGETRTRPTLFHDPARPRQRSEPLGITPEQRSAIVEAMKLVPITGTAKRMNTAAYRIPGLVVAGKTGTAQVNAPGGGFLEIGWYVCFAPADNPQIAVAVVVEGEPREATSGGLFAAPVAHTLLKEWWRKQNRAPATPAAAQTPRAKG